MILGQMSEIVSNLLIKQLEGKALMEDESLMYTAGLRYMTKVFESWTNDDTKHSGQFKDSDISDEESGQDRQES